VEDLRAFRDELNRVAPLFRPNLNDGVIINYAPLWRMIALPKWRKDCQGIWEELVSGKYDWAHLAMHLWPERVIPKCATDRSLAIAHDLEQFFWEEIPEDETKPRKTSRRRKSAGAKTEPENLALDSDETPAESSELEAPIRGSGIWRPRQVTEAEIQKLIAERTSLAVKSALESLGRTGTEGAPKRGTTRKRP
jgi:hypothetical protein